MKRVLVIALIALVALAVAAPAPAASPTLKSLARQITALQKQVKTLKKQVTEARAVAATALVYGACSTAVTADAFQGTWTFLEQKYPASFGPQTPVNDYQTCQPLRITRAPAQVPPNTSVFNSLLALFRT
jgi:endonuclease/exonuclease/phosphatase (EEP) superfamily protein YafD